MSREHILILHSQLFTRGHTHCDSGSADMRQHFRHFIWLLDALPFLVYQVLFFPPLPPAIPPGLVLQVDGKKRRADRVCGGQRHLPQADGAATGLFLPLQRRLHCHQEEEVSLLIISMVDQ